MIEWVLVDAVVGERREAQQDADVLRVRVVDQLAHEIAPDVEVVAVVLPRFRISLRAEAPRDPEHDRVRPVLGEAVDRVLPLRQVPGLDAAGDQVVTARLLIRW
jgi:hypothetical protein